MTLPVEKGLSRLEDILQTVGLSSKLVRDECEIENCLTDPIDYDAVSTRIQEVKKRSEAFLQEALR